jgi:integrase
MRRTGHIRERSPGSFELRYSLGADLATGRRRIATVTVRGTRKEAEKELRRLLRTLDTGEHVDPTRMTTARWLETWLAAVREEIAPRSYDRYAGIVERHLIPWLGNLPVAKLAPGHIQEFYNQLAVGGRRDGRSGALAPRSRRQIHRVLTTALKRAVEQQVIGRNPCDSFQSRLPRVEQREMATLSAEQASNLIEHTRNSELYWPVLLALATGMRRGEVLALRWRSVDIDRGILRVVESLEQTSRGLRFKPPKNNRSRAITLPRFAIEELRWRKREQAETLLALGMRQDESTVICARANGEPLAPVALTHLFSRLIESLKDHMPRIRFHDLRHTHATQLLIAGVHPRIAQERLGHSTVALTLDLYSHVTPTMQEDAASKIDFALRPAKKTFR